MASIIHLTVIRSAAGKLVLARRGDRWRLRHAESHAFVNISAATAASALRIANRAQGRASAPPSVPNGMTAASRLRLHAPASRELR